MTDEQKISTLVKALRTKRLGMTQYEFGQDVGIREQNISRYERGVGAPEPPMFDKLIRKAQEIAPELVPGFAAEFERIYGAAAPSTEARLSPDKEALISSIRALLADERYSGKLSNKLSSILLDMQENTKMSVAPRKKVR